MKELNEGRQNNLKMNDKLTSHGEAPSTTEMLDVDLFIKTGKTPTQTKPHAYCNHYTQHSGKKNAQKHICNVSKHEKSEKRRP